MANQKMIIILFSYSKRVSICSSKETFYIYDTKSRLTLILFSLLYHTSFQESQNYSSKKKSIVSILSTLKFSRKDLNYGSFKLTKIEFWLRQAESLVL